MQVSRSTLPHPALSCETALRTIQIRGVSVYSDLAPCEAASLLCCAPVSTVAYDTPPARRVRVLAAGGTIGMETKASDGGKPALGAEELLASVDGLGQVEGETVINVPSAHLRLED